MIELQPLGDRAFLARFPTEAEAAGWAQGVAGVGWPGIDVVPAYRSVAVLAELDRVEVGMEDLEDRLRSVASSTIRTRGTTLRLPVLYDGEDLPEVARRLHLTVDEVIAAHSGPEYQVFAIGFLPGFPYAGYLPPTLGGLPRREVPRVRVPAGSVAIAGVQTGVYPAESPGGWHLLGRTPLRIVDLERGLFPIRAGDRLCFVPIDQEEFAARKGELL